MYKVTFNSKTKQSYYNTILISSDKTHYLSIYVSNDDNNVFATISKSEDGFHFKSPCDEATGLKIDSKNSIEEVYNNIKNYFLEKGYQFSPIQ